MEYFIKHYFGKIIKQSAKTRYFTMKLLIIFLILSILCIFTSSESSIS